MLLLWLGGMDSRWTHVDSTRAVGVSSRPPLDEVELPEGRRMRTERALNRYGTDAIRRVRLSASIALGADQLVVVFRRVREKLVRGLGKRVLVATRARKDASHATPPTMRTILTA